MKGSNDNRDTSVHFAREQPVPTSRTRNVTIGGARSSIRLEDAFWDGLDEIIQREGVTLDQLITGIRRRLSPDANLSGAVRVFIQSYYYALSQKATPRLPPGSRWRVPKLRN
ncbi:ribbon-helix-helix domain-containing protein [Inquilinus ginsengisoli]|uniref:ribbon-helix-helix domain-containing protein n=1 Tax=Inquilinus ginsengisoli TaxID=363840 RepID=UPI003D1A9E32